MSEHLGYIADSESECRPRIRAPWNSDFGFHKYKEPEEVTGDTKHQSDPTPEGENSEMTFSSLCMAQYAAPIIEALKRTKAISRGAKYLAPRAGKFRSVVNTVGDIAGALGFNKQLQDRPIQNKGKRRNSRKRRNKKVIAASSAMNTAGAANAPVAFARTEALRPYFAAYPSETADGMIVHGVDYVGPTITASATAGALTFDLGQYVSPSNSTLFPWLANLGPMFERYKLKMLRIHYEHYCATNVQGQIILQYFPDPDINGSVLSTLTQAQLQNSGNYMTGACYEDFCHTCDLTGIDKSQWYNTEFTVTGDNDANYCGRVGVWLVNMAASQAGTGNIWIESVFEFNTRKVSSITAGLGGIRRIVESKLDVPSKLKYGKLAVQRIVELQQEEKKLEAQEEKEAVFTSFLKELEGPVTPEPAPSARILQSELITVPAKWK